MLPVVFGQVFYLQYTSGNSLIHEILTFFCSDNQCIPALHPFNRTPKNRVVVLKSWSNDPFAPDFFCLGRAPSSE